MIIHPLRSGQPVSEKSGGIHQHLRMWLEKLALVVDLGIVPHKGIVWCNLSADDIADYFTSGLGNTRGKYAGWAICNGSNGTPDLSGRFTRSSVTAAGGTGGSDSSAHTHSVDPASVTSGAPSATTEVQAGVGSTVASSTHTHAVDVAATTSGAASATENRPAYYELVPLMRLEIV